MPVHFSPEAAQDIEEIGDYIEAENPLAARRFLSAPRKRCLRIEDAPRSGVSRPELQTGMRSIAFRRCMIFYAFDQDTVRIERVLHGARDIEAVFEGDE